LHVYLNLLLISIMFVYITAYAYACIVVYYCNLGFCLKEVSFFDFLLLIFVVGAGASDCLVDYLWNVLQCVKQDVNLYTLTQVLIYCQTQHLVEAEFFREWCDRRGTVVPVHANNGTSWGRAWKWPSLAHPTSAVRRAGVSTNHGQTSACRWLLRRRRWELTARWTQRSGVWCWQLQTVL